MFYSCVRTSYFRLRQSALDSKPSRICNKSKRLGLENKERTYPLSTACTSLRLILLALTYVVFLSGCAENSFQVRDPVQERALSSPLASEVLLEVDDASVKWGSGKVGPALKTALVKRQIFGQVHFPIYPTHE